MDMSPRDYWRMVCKQAWVEARRKLGLADPIKFLLSIIVGFAVILALWFWDTKDAATTEMIVRVVAGGIIVLALPVIWLWKSSTIPVSLYNESRNEIQRLEDAAKPRLKIEGLYKETNYRWVEIHPSRREYFCRIAVQNLSTNEEINGVTVRITRFEGEGSFDVPQTLLPKRQTINAGLAQNWTVATGSHVALGEEVDLTIIVNYHGQTYRTFANKIEMTIEASAAKIAPSTRDFILCRDEERRPMLIPKDEIDGSP